MYFHRIIWDHQDGGNVEHIDEHDLTISDVEYVLQHVDEQVTSHSTNRPCVFGYTPDGEYIIVVYEWVDASTILPITAYQVPEAGEQVNRA